MHDDEKSMKVNLIMRLQDKKGISGHDRLCVDEAQALTSAEANKLIGQLMAKPERNTPVREDVDEDAEPLDWWDLHEDEVMERRALDGDR